MRIVQRAQPARDAGGFRLRPPEADARAETRDDPQLLVLAIRQPRVVAMDHRRQAERQPEVGYRDAGAEEILRRDAGDRHRGAIETDRQPEHRWIAAEAPRPVVLADERRGRRAHLLGRDRIERTPARGGDAQDVEVVLRHHERRRELDVVGRTRQQTEPSEAGRRRRGVLRDDAARAGERQAIDQKCDHAVERGHAVAIGLVFRVAEDEARAAARAQQREVDETTGIARVEWARHRRAIGGEHRGVDADAERQREAGGRREPRVAPKASQRVSRVTNEIANPGPPALSAHRLGRLCETARSERGVTGGGRRRVAAPQRVLARECEMSGELVVKVRVAAAPPPRAPKPGEPLSQDRHPRLVSRARAAARP